VCVNKREPTSIFFNNQQTSPLFLASFELAPVVGQIACARMLLNIQDVMRVSMPLSDAHTHTAVHYSSDSRPRSAVRGRRPPPNRDASFYVGSLPSRIRGDVTDITLGTESEAFEMDVSKDVLPLPTSPPGVDNHSSYDGVYEPLAVAHPIEPLRPDRSGDDTLNSTTEPEP